jgi:hypothetical protein
VSGGRGDSAREPCARFVRAKERLPSHSCALRFCRWGARRGGPVLAGSDPPDVANGTGDDPTQPPLYRSPRSRRRTGNDQTSRNEHAVRPDRDAAVEPRAAMGVELPSRNSGGVDKRRNAREPDRRDRVRLRQRAHSGVDRARLRSTLGGCARRAIDRAELDQWSGD